MDVRFEPIQLLSINDVQYCDFCSQADLTGEVHSDHSCILEQLNLIGNSTCDVKCLNFGFYQCFLKNCNTQVRESEEFVLHLKSHGISLEGATIESAESSCSHDPIGVKRKKGKLSEHDASNPKKIVVRSHCCTNCSYSTTQRRYLESHKQKCTVSKTPKSSAPGRFSKKVTAPAHPPFDLQATVKKEQIDASFTKPEINFNKTGRLVSEISSNKPGSLIFKRPSIVISANQKIKTSGSNSFRISNDEISVQSSDISKISSKLDYPKLQCSFCSYKAKLSIMVKNHERRCKSRLKFPCSSCSDGFPTEEELNLHTSTCSIEPKNGRPSVSNSFACQKCPYLAIRSEERRVGKECRL